MNKIILFKFLLIMAIQLVIATEKDSNRLDKEGVINIDVAALKEANIVVKPLFFKNIANEIDAQAEIKLNAYLSEKITPRITAQVIKRHVKLGNKVEKGQVLVTLSSVIMAEAKAELLTARNEWVLVQKLGKSNLSNKRYSMAKIKYNIAYSKLLVYGLTKKQISNIYHQNINQLLGNFQLFASQSGVIVVDNFIKGELIEPGQVLFNIVNEKLLWVEAQLSPQYAELVKIGVKARVEISKDSWVNGIVIQKHHLLNKKTRTIGIRVEINNKDDKLHPGMYVNTKIQIDEKNYI